MFRAYISYIVSFFFFKQKTAYEMRISDWSSDVCSSDLVVDHGPRSAEAPLGFVGEPAHAELAFAIIGPSVVVQDRVDAGARAVAEGAAERAARVCVSRSEFPLGAWELAESTHV